VQVNSQNVALSVALFAVFGHFNQPNWAAVKTAAQILATYDLR
jgi:hypothetical protein